MDAQATTTAAHAGFPLAPTEANTTVATIEGEKGVTLLMELLEQTQEGQYSCTETFDLLDEYVEIVTANKQEAANLMPYVKQHLDHCKDCIEQYETLLQVLQGS